MNNAGDRKKIIRELLCDTDREMTDEELIGELLHTSVTENNAAKEVDYAFCGFLVGFFEVKYNRAARKKMFADLTDFVKAFRLYDLHFKSRTGGYSAGRSGSGGLLLNRGGRSRGRRFFFLVFFVFFVFFVFLFTLEKVAETVHKSHFCSS